MRVARGVRIKFIVDLVDVLVVKLQTAHDLLATISLASPTRSSVKRKRLTNTDNGMLHLLI